jgi:hypothetical protein
MGPNAGPKRIRSGPSAFGSYCVAEPKTILGPAPIGPNSNGFCWGHDPTHDLFMYLIIYIIQNYWIKNLKTIKHW